MAVLTVSIGTDTVSKNITAGQLTRLQNAITTTLGGNPLTNQQMLNYIMGMLAADLINLTQRVEQQAANQTVTNISFT